MLKLHSLAYSRAIRVAWLLENLDTPYEVIGYDRTEAFRAPDALKAVHPLGKSPVIEDDGLTLAESSAILRYVDMTYGGGRHEPEPGTRAYFEHAEWLDYAESTAAGPILAAAMDKAAGKDTAPEDPRMAAQLDTNLDYMADRLADRDFVMGDTLMLADIQMSYLFSLLEMAGRLEDRPVLAAYWQRLQAHPGFKAATEKCGPMSPPSS
ncbi:glutathione S-transferase family protein [Salipiger sp. IMCC34102]|uniref:glutathione S-transferase family protein n=1 Tax=Salipiger sp. IMCC34102 TaxID=2510647 RepID=UPI00101CC0FA|nr:glutathione S-transferase family protein [Salipiger sp. IMCC34102]RYH00779.1 glutathione S-transferase family protein [Salipiger sp. IMCC34102]